MQAQPSNSNNTEHTLGSRPSSSQAMPCSQMGVGLRRISSSSVVLGGQVSVASASTPSSGATSPLRRLQPQQLSAPPPIRRQPLPPLQLVPPPEVRMQRMQLQSHRQPDSLPNITQHGHPAVDHAFPSSHGAVTRSAPAAASPPLERWPLPPPPYGHTNYSVPPSETGLGLFNTSTAPNSLETPYTSSYETPATSWESSPLAMLPHFVPPSTGNMPVQQRSAPSPPQLQSHPLPHITRAQMEAALQRRQAGPEAGKSTTGHLAALQSNEPPDRINGGAAANLPRRDESDSGRSLNLSESETEKLAEQLVYALRQRWVA